MENNIVIQAMDLTASYGNKQIWRNATFTIKEGEFVALLGPNGGGKTTLFRLILGLVKPSYGSLYIFGEKPTKGNRQIGYIPQRRLIDSEFKLQALEFVLLGLTGTHWGININISKREKGKGLEALRQINSLELAYRSMGELSGGELQRVFLAQALISKPKLLLLDEPMANLDIKREKDFVDLLGNISKLFGISILIITHDINPLLSVTDKIIYIANKNIETGSIDEVINSEALSALYGIPVEVLHDSKGRIAVFGIEGEVHHE